MPSTPLQLAAIALLIAGNLCSEPAKSDLPERAGRAPANKVVRSVFVDSLCAIVAVADGDTVTCKGGERVRLLLIDAPEMSQGPLGVVSRTALLQLLPTGTTVRLEFDIEKRDRYGRLLAYLFLKDGRMVNREMARGGFAVPLVYPPNVRDIELIRAAVDSARSERLGLWETNAFECEPRDFRRGLCD